MEVSPLEPEVMVFKRQQSIRSKTVAHNILEWVNMFIHLGRNI